jgi:hypothetical protein
MRAVFAAVALAALCGCRFVMAPESPLAHDGDDPRGRPPELVKAHAIDSRRQVRSGSERNRGAATGGDTNFLASDEPSLHVDE